MGKKNIILNNSIINKIKIIEEINPTVYDNGKKTRRVKCLCYCGATFNVSFSDIKNQHTKSCGCYSREMARERHLKHGMSGTNFYDIYSKIKSRCENPNDKDYYLYGKRGIRCLWNNFIDFKNDMYKEYKLHIKKNTGGNTRIDRINNNGDYTKNNCKWSTHKEQARNRRSNHLLTLKGKTLTITEWSELTKIPRYAIYNRIKKGWDVKDVLTIKYDQTRTNPAR